MSRFVIYNASAGSGKTFTLAVQFIARMMSARRHTDRPYQKILAVTFTNKATAEMKDRILQQLYGVGAGLRKSDIYLRNISAALNRQGVVMSDESIRSESRRLLLDILHDYSHFRVETIDSFFHSVMVDMARELGLPANLRTDINDQGIIGEAVDRIINRLDQSDQLRSWVTEYIAERMDGGQHWDVAREIKTFARHIFDQEYTMSQDALTDFLCDDDKVRSLRRRLDDTHAMMLSTLSEYLSQSRDICTPENMKALKGLSYFESHLKKVEALLSGAKWKGTSSSVAKMGRDYTALLRSKPKAGDEALAARVSEQIAGFLKVQDEALIRLNTVSLTRRHLNPMRLLAYVAREAGAVANERGSFLLANTSILLNRMVSDDDASFIYEKTGSYLRHTMLDEFQDTSLLQWSNFQTLISDNMSKGGSTLVVGDVKQSIYRWRGGRPSILATLPQTMSRFSPHSEPLRTNYRSSSRIISLNNSLYKALTVEVGRMAGKDETGWDLGSIYKSDEVEQQTPNDKRVSGYARITCQTDGKPSDMREEAAVEMCSIIGELLENKTDPQDIAILIRYNKDLPLVAKYFAQHLPSVTLVSDQAFALSQSPAVSILINALRSILHPDDSASLGRLVSLYNRGTTLNELFDSSDPRHPFSSACRFLPLEFGDLSFLRSLPVFELLSRLDSMFGLSQMEGQSAYLLTFYDHIVKALPESASSLTTLLDFWDTTLSKKSIPSGEMRGVTIMTIHRAKGLEWKHVFMPFCDWTLYDETRVDNIMWCRPNTDDLCGLPLAAVPICSAASQSIYSSDYTAERQSQRIDNLNLLYVATTRASENLYMWGNAKEPQQGESDNPTMSLLIRHCLSQLPREGRTLTEARRTTYTLGTEREEREDDKSHRQQDEKDEKDEKPNRLILSYTAAPIDTSPYPALLSFRQSREASDFTDSREYEGEDGQREAYINTGTVLHEIFANIRRAGDLETAISRIPVSLTQTGAGSVSLGDTARRLFRQGLSNPVVADWFSGRYRVLNECSILEPSDNGRAQSRRPDRVMMSDDEIIVVDFKFARPRPEHHTQVGHYASLIRSLYPTRRCTAFLWYVYSNHTVTVSNS